jgi:hypothetical protein
MIGAVYESLQMQSVRLLMQFAQAGLCGTLLIVTKPNRLPVLHFWFHDWR